MSQGIIGVKSFYHIKYLLKKKFVEFNAKYGEICVANENY